MCGESLSAGFIIIIIIIITLLFHTQSLTAHPLPGSASLTLLICHSHLFLLHTLALVHLWPPPPFLCAASSSLSSSRSLPAPCPAPSLQYVFPDKWGHEKRWIKGTAPPGSVRQSDAAALANLLSVSSLTHSLSFVRPPPSLESTSPENRTLSPALLFLLFG